MVPEGNSPAPITYYALDLEERELQRTLDQITTSDVGRSLSGKVDTKGMWGTYDAGLKFVESGGLQSQKVLGKIQITPGKEFGFTSGEISPISSGSTTSDSSSEVETTPPSTPDGAQRPLHILFLGSSLGNFGREDSSKFLRGLPLRLGAGDTLLLGMDHDNGKELIEQAYNDRRGYTKRFIMNGLKAAGRALGDETIFDEDNWEYVNQYNVVSQFFSSLV